MQKKATNWRPLLVRLTGTIESGGSLGSQPGHLGELHFGPEGLLAGVVQVDARRRNNIFFAIHHDTPQILLFPIDAGYLRAVDIVFGRRDVEHARQQG